MDIDCSLPQIEIHPGESHLALQPGILRTLLGSCVGITFWVRRLRIGALCHPMLPTVTAQHPLAPDPRSERRFVDFAILDVSQQLCALGATVQETEVKLFGGADVLHRENHRARPSLGEMNREAAVRVLEAEGYRIAASCVGGQSGVQIRFNTANGEVLLRRLGSLRKHRSKGPTRALESEG